MGPIRMQMETRVVEAIRPTRLVFHTVSPNMPIDFGFDLYREGEGTRAVMWSEPQPVGLVRRLWPLLKIMVRRGAAANLERMKHVLETTR